MAKAKSDSEIRKARKTLEKAGESYAERHVFLCNDTRKEGCASAKRMRRAWKRLEQAVADAKLDRGGRVVCSRTRCFGICEAGPIAVVYPDGVWYGGVEDEAIDVIVERHLAGGKIVEANAIRVPGNSRKS